jgi:hypothetical protein
MLSRLALGTALVAAIAFGQAASVGAQQASGNCGPRDEVLKQLASKYHEAPVAVGMSSNGTVLEVLAALDGSTWTALVTRASGISCVMMSGEAWETQAPQFPSLPVALRPGDLIP